MNDPYDIPGEAPFYTDFLYKVQEDYPNAGLAETFIKYEENHSSISRLYSHKDELIELFNLAYRYHELGSETEDRWQYQIDKRFELIKNRYERYFMMYDTKDIDTLGKILSETISREGTSNRNTSSESSGTSKDVFNDTPITPLMDTHNYATNITDGTNENESSGTTETEYEDTITTSKTDKDKSNLELVEKNVNIWKDLIVSFVDEFRNCFMDEITRI